MSKALKMIAKLIKGQSLRRLIPYLGIFAFAGSSTHALTDYLNAKALNPSMWYSIASWLIELFSALIIGEASMQAKVALSSISGGMTKEKRRRGRVFASTFALLAIPTVAVSVVANTAEFRGDILLGSLFPSLCISCAIASVLPDVAKAKEKPTVSDDSESPPKPKQRKQEGLFARCACGKTFGPFKTEKKRINARNGHQLGRCGKDWIE